jgi:hypothetical protein
MYISGKEHRCKYNEFSIIMIMPFWAFFRVSTGLATYFSSNTCSSNLNFHVLRQIISETQNFCCILLRKDKNTFNNI